MITIEEARASMLAALDQHHPKPRMPAGCSVGRSEVAGLRGCGGRVVGHLYLAGPGHAPGFCEEHARRDHPRWVEFLAT